MNKTIKELNLEDDFLFAKVMTDKHVCKKVLEKILNIKISKIEMPQDQKVVDLLLESKGIRLDIYVNDENGTIYNVEMQKGNNKNLAKRSRYYQGNIDLDLISKGDDYRKLKKSFVIFICTFDPFDRGRHLYTFNNLCVQDTSLMLNDETNKVFLSTKGILNDVDEELAEFLGYIENSTDEYVSHAKSNLVKEIHERVIEVKQDKRMEVEFMTLLERDREKFEEGVEKGIQKGIEQGIEKGKREAAKALIGILEDEVIAEKIGLKLEEVKKLH